MNKQMDGIEQKDVIKRLTGKVTKLWEAKTFNGKNGEFTIQKGEIEIDGEVYGLAFWNNTQPESLKNKTVILSSTRGKHGLNGVVLDHESYDGKNGHVDRDVIKVTGSGKVEIEGQRSEEPPRVNSPRLTEIGDPKKAIQSIVDMHLFINEVVRAAYAGKVEDEETLRSYVASVFIEANKKGIVYSEPVEPAKPDPKDWASVVVPSGSMKGKTLGSVGKPALTKLYQHFWKEGFNTDFAKCVEQAGADLGLPISSEEDDIPMEDQPEIPW